MAGRYLPTELQNDEGDIVYPHTQADIVWFQDGQSVEKVINDNVTDEQIKSIFEK